MRLSTAARNWRDAKRVCVFARSLATNLVMYICNVMGGDPADAAIQVRHARRRAGTGLSGVRPGRARGGGLTGVTAPTGPVHTVRRTAAGVGRRGVGFGNAIRMCRQTAGRNDASQHGACGYQRLSDVPTEAASLLSNPCPIQPMPSTSARAPTHPSFSALSVPHNAHTTSPHVKHHPIPPPPHPPHTRHRVPGPHPQTHARH